MGKTLYLIGEASEDEIGGTVNGLLGDQSGFELRAREWYDHNNGWAKVFRFNDPDIAEEIASRIESAIANGFVGYDTNHRRTFPEALQAVDMVVEDVVTDCCCDCSSLAYTAILGATGVEYDHTIRQYPAFCSTNNTNVPKVRDYDDYIERQCVKAGFGVTVFTLKTAVADADKQEGVTYDTVTFGDSVKLNYPVPHYDTPYDHYDSVADPSSVNSNLTLIYLNESNPYNYTETFLTTFLTYQPSSGSPKESAWQRGDIIRTLCKPNGNGKYSGHVVVWL